MNNLEAITKQMNSLEAQIQIEQKYIAKHGQANDAREYDEQWEQMKKEAQRNLDKWDQLKEQRDYLKRQNLLIQNNTLVMEFMGRLPKPTLNNHYSISDSPFYTCVGTLEECMTSFAKYAKYPVSWDWLIPVIKKIREIIETEMSLYKFDKFRHFANRLNPYNHDIGEVYLYCIEFIKSYNHLKNSTDATH